MIAEVNLHIAYILISIKSKSYYMLHQFSNKWYQSHSSWIYNQDILFMIHFKGIPISCG